MEDTRGNLQSSRNEMKKSTGGQDDGPHPTSIHISSGDNSQSNTLIEYDHDVTLEIKEEIILDQERHPSGDHNLLPDKNHLEEKPTFRDNNFGCRTLIKYDNDGTLQIKEEIIQEIHQSGDHDLLSGKKQPEGKSVFCENNSGVRTLIEYDDDETLEIKEEVVQDRENTGQTYNKKYELKLCTVDISADDILAAKNLQCTPVKQKMQESKQDKRKKSRTSQPRHNCAKCSRSYITKRGLMQHESLEHAAVKPQFICDICSFKTNIKHVLSRHISVVHFKMSKASQARHNCNKCSRSYSSLGSLYRHDRLQHAAVIPQFICDCCGYKTNMKCHLATHISLCHFKKPKISQARHNCRKCSLNYSSSSALKQHYSLKHAAVIPQFICDVCGYKTNRKHDFSRHISVRHCKKSTASQVRHNCYKCSRTYSSLASLYRHDRLQHAAVIPQFICDCCGYKTNMKCHLSTHISLCHFKELKISQPRHNCRKCSLSYSSLSALKQHDNLEHAAVKPQFICDACGYKTNRKHDFSRHISVRPCKKSTSSQASFNCNKCSRWYSYLGNLSRHDRLEHAAVKPQFICDVCGYITNRKYYLSRHISLRHFDKSTSLQARHKCDKCFRSYTTRRALNRHGRLKHPKE